MKYKCKKNYHNYKAGEVYNFDDNNRSKAILSTGVFEPYEKADYEKKVTKPNETKKRGAKK